MATELATRTATQRRAFMPRELPTRNRRLNLVVDLAVEAVELVIFEKCTRKILQKQLSIARIKDKELFADTKVECEHPAPNKKYEFCFIKCNNDSDKSGKVFCSGRTTGFHKFSKNGKCKLKKCSENTQSNCSCYDGDEIKRELFCGGKKTCDMNGPVWECKKPKEDDEDE